MVLFIVNPFNYVHASFDSQLNSTHSLSGNLLTFTLLNKKNSNTFDSNWNPFNGIPFIFNWIVTSSLWFLSVSNWIQFKHHYCYVSFHSQWACIQLTLSYIIQYQWYLVFPIEYHAMSLFPLFFTEIHLLPVICLSLGLFLWSPIVFHLTSMVLLIFNWVPFNISVFPLIHITVSIDSPLNSFLKQWSFLISSPLIPNEIS